MAIPTTVNSQITDAVTQVNTKVLGDAPAMSIGQLYQTTAHALSMAAENAAASQQQSNLTTQAATTAGVSTLLTLDEAATGAAGVKIVQ